MTRGASSPGVALPSRKLTIPAGAAGPARSSGASQSSGSQSANSNVVEHHKAFLVPHNVNKHDLILVSSKLMYVVHQIPYGRQ